MSIIINDNLKINAGKPVEYRYLSATNAVYASTGATNTAIPITLRYVGLTVNINNVEYWYKNGVADSNLIEKKYDNLLPSSDYVTGATNNGYFSGKTGQQILPIDHLTNNTFDGNYVSLYNNYYRGTDGKIHVGVPSDGIFKRGYVKTTGLPKSWIWNDYTGGSDLVGWILIDGNISQQLGTFQYSSTPLYYNGSTTYPYNQTGWTTNTSYNNSSNLTINSVIGSLNTGNTLTIGGRPFATKNNNVLNFRTVISETPATIVVRDDESFIYLSGTSRSINNINISGGTDIIVSAITGNNIIIFDGAKATGTMLSWDGTHINLDNTSQYIINNAIIAANNGLTYAAHNVSLGGALTGNTNITGNYTLSIASGAKMNSDCGYQISGNTILRTSLQTISTIFLAGAGGINNTGHDNIGIGCDSLYYNTIGCANMGLGNGALYNNTSGENNIALGNGALFNNITGCNNIAVGEYALNCNTTGSNNIANGYIALNANTIGSSNIAIGNNTLSYNTTGNNNIATGSHAGYLNVTGSSNVFIGGCAGYNELGSNKLYIANNANCNLIYGDFIENYVTLPTVKLCNIPADGLITDSLLVWNSSNMCIKKLQYCNVLNNVLTGATNGLTKTGKNAVLGGTLTGLTTINLNNSQLILKSDATCGYGLAQFRLNSVYASSSFAVCSRDATATAMWGITGNSTSICGLHYLNSTNGSDFSINNTSICFTNKISNVIKSISLGANALVYASNYCANYTNRTLVDKEYVDTKVSGSSNIVNVNITGAPYTTQANDDFVGVSGSSCIYLINAPKIGQRVAVVDVCGNAFNAPITIDGNGNAINDGSDSMINTNYGSITVVFNGYRWSVTAFVN